MKYLYSDGGRDAAGYPNVGASDCVARAVSLASGEPYGKVYEALAAGNRSQPRGRGQAKTYGSHSADFGIDTASAWFKVYMTELGFEWMATTLPGAGPIRHMKADELPLGRLVAIIHKHAVAVVDQVIYDTFDPTRGGRLAVKVEGYWMLRAKRGTEGILDKVRKLLALSQDNTSEHEAALAAQRAHDLLAKHNLSLADATVLESPERIEEPFATPYKDHAIAVLWADVARANYCKLLQITPNRSTGEGYKFFIVGTRTNIAVSAMMAEYLTQTMLRLTAHAVEDNRGSGVHGKTVRKDFMLGMASTLARRLHEMTRRDHGLSAEVAPAAPSTSTALALYSRNERKENDAYIDLAYGRLRSSSYRPGVGRDSDAYAAGKAAGERVSLDKQVQRYAPQGAEVGN